MHAARDPEGVAELAMGSTGWEGLGGGRGARVRVTPGGGCGGAGSPGGGCGGAGYPRGGYGGTGDPWVWGGGAGYFREGSKSPEGAGVLCLRIETM